MSKSPSSSLSPYQHNHHHHHPISFLAKLQNTSKPEEEQQQKSLRKKSPWDRANIRKVTSRGKEQTSPLKTDGSRDNTPRSDEKTASSNSERKTAKQRKPGLKNL